MQLVAFLAALGLAAQLPASNVAAYDPAFFAESRPATAYDMISRLPGFTLIESDDEVRGFAGAAGNVLIDGRPPASKQESLEELLRRIPADAVERIELIRGGAPGIDMGGFEVVANVVRRRTANRSAAATAGLSIGLDGVVRPRGQLEASRQSAGRRAEGNLSFKSQGDEDSGQGRLVEREVGSDESKSAARREIEVETTIAASGEYETPLLGGTGSLNASLEREVSRSEVTSRDDDGDSESALEEETVWNSEAAGRLGGELGEGSQLDGLLLHRRGWIRGTEQENDELFAESTRTDETIARIEYKRERRAVSLDVSLEGAVNGLASRARLTEGGMGVPLPGGDARVREQRAEAAASATWRARPDVVFEAGAQVEVSSLKSEQQRLSFVFWKPRVAVTAPFGPIHMRASIGREVGQLDFRDFVASASPERGDVSAGAVSLRPPQSWVASAAGELRFWKEGAVTLSWRREWIEDVVDRVAVVVNGDIFDAVGNIGAGRRDIAQAELALPLSRFGLTGVQLRGALTVRRSRVIDPTTGERRSISEDVPVEGHFQLTHDVPGGRWSWGLDLALGEREREFRFDEVRQDWEGASLSAHVEYRPSPAWRIRAEGLNLTGRTIRETREKYDGLRGNVPLDETEERWIATSPLLLVTVRRAFGAGRP